MRREALKTRLRQLEEALHKYETEHKETLEECFDTLGFDLLVVDECHNYKNITIDLSDGDSGKINSMADLADSRLVFELS